MNQADLGISFLLDEPPARMSLSSDDSSELGRFHLLYRSDEKDLDEIERGAAPAELVSVASLAPLYQ